MQITHTMRNFKLTSKENTLINAASSHRLILQRTSPDSNQMRFLDGVGLWVVFEWVDGVKGAGW